MEPEAATAPAMTSLWPLRYLVALVAIGLSYGTYLMFRGQIELATSGIVFLQSPQLAMGVLFGVAIGLGGSLVSVGRHLRNV